MRCVLIGDKPVTDNVLDRLTLMLGELLSLYITVDFYIAGNETFKAAAADICSQICAGQYYAGYYIIQYEDTGERHCITLHGAHMIEDGHLEEWRDIMLISKADYLILYTDRRTPAVSEWIKKYGNKLCTII